MKLIMLFSLSSLLYLATACGQSYQEDNYEEESYNVEYAEVGGQQFDANTNNQNVSNNSQPNTNWGGNGDKIMHPVKDSKTGMLVGQIPIPSNWKIVNGVLQGPNGIQARDYPGGSFMEQQRRINSIDQIVREDIIPRINQVGGKVRNTFRIPEIAQYDRTSYAQYWKAAPSQDSHDVMGIDIQDNQGNTSLIIVHFTYSRSQYGNMSFYYLNQLQANPSSYEQAKKDYIYALANFKMNPQYIAAHNQREQQKSQVSWNNHNQKMRNNQANFNARNKAHMDTYNEINRMSMETYNYNNQSSDRIQGQIVDGIWGEQNMYDPNTGQQYKVESGYNNYYMNNNNEYIGTDDNFYNPQTDPNLNNTDWRKIEESNNNW